MSSTPFRYTLVETSQGLADAIADLRRFKEIAFDSEGVNLGRTGALTVACLLGIDTAADDDGASCAAVAYVIDVQALGGRAAFCTTGLGELLASRDVLKITFDCRADSDALYHQFGVRLGAVLDLQVYEQAVRLTNGSSLPERTGVSRAFLPFVKGMSHMAQKYLSYNVMRNLGGFSDNGPHKTDALVWQRRPMRDSVIAYAAYDVHIARLLLLKFRAHDIPRVLMDGVARHSERYVSHLRDRAVEATWARDKDFIMEELPIVSREALRSAQEEIHLAAEARRRAEMEAAVARAQLEAAKAAEQRKHREVIAAADGVRLKLERAKANQAKLSAMREAILSGELLARVEKSLAQAALGAETLADKLRVADAEVAALPPGAVDAAKATAARDHIGALARFIGMRGHGDGSESDGGRDEDYDCYGDGCYEDDYEDYDRYSRGEAKDYTACSSDDCGWCGRCSY